MPLISQALPNSIEVRVRANRPLYPQSIQVTVVPGRVPATLAEFQVSPPPPPAVRFIGTEAPSEQFELTVSESHTAVVRVDVLRMDILDQPVTQLSVVEGSITMDATQATRRSATLVVIDEDGTLTPDIAADILSPFTCELRIWKGIQFPDGSQELISCGIFKPTKYDLLNDGGRVAYRLTCLDRSVRAQKNFGTPYVVQAEMKVEDAIRDLIRLKSPTLPVKLPETGFITPPLVLDASKNPWGEATKFAQSSGYTLNINREGVLEMYQTPNQVTLPVAWELRDNSRSTMWDMERAVDGDNAPNHVIVRGTNSQLPTFGEAKDMDARSRTWVNGPYGDLLREVQDERITTNEQAEAAAAAILWRGLGRTERFPVSAVPNPAMNLDDAVHVEHTVAGVSSYGLVDRIELPLTADKEMTVEVRQPKATDAEVITSIVTAPPPTAPPPEGTGFPSTKVVTVTIPVASASGGGAGTATPASKVVTVTIPTASSPGTAVPATKAVAITVPTASASGGGGAIAATNKTSGNTSGVSSVNTASHTPTASRLNLLSVFSFASTTPNVPTVSGNGSSWVQVATQLDTGGETRVRLTMFRYLAASPSAGAATIDFGGQTQTFAIGWILDEFSNIDTGGTNGSAAIVQSAGDADLSVTLGAFGSTNNATYGAAANFGGLTQGTGFTEMAEVNAAGSGSLQTQFRNDNDTSVDWSGSATQDFALAVEIKRA